MMMMMPPLPQLGPSQHSVHICNTAKLLSHTMLPCPTLPRLMYINMLLLGSVFLYAFVQFVAWLLLPPPLQPLLLLAVCTCGLLDPVLDVPQLPLAR
jgi:hypothetical protein